MLSTFIFSFLVLNLSYADSVDNPLWGFRCNSQDNQTTVTIALQNKKVISITVLPELDGQIMSSRSTTLNEKTEGYYSGLYRPQTIHYEMIFKIDVSEVNEVPKILEASLKENGIASTALSCLPVFQKRTNQIISM